MNWNLKTFLFLLLTNWLTLSSQEFVSVRDGQFFQNNKPYYFVGANYWYGSYLGNETNPQKGIERLKRELDFLKQKNVTNLRVLVAVEGTGKINGANRVTPPYQPEAGIFNDEILKGLDIFLAEASKRNMKAVLFLSNNWEWSGGFLQYLRWNDKIEENTFRKAMNWDELRDETRKFYRCDNCIAQYRNQVQRIVTRTNTITGIPYKNDPTIMTWEIANEPRPMRPNVIPEFKKFIAETASFIKSLDENHLVTSGSEGEMGSETMDLFKEVHSDSNIDYLTIHIWPKNWGWLNINDLEGTFSKAEENTLSYINNHIEVANQLRKPLVLEEFGFPRDHHSFDINSSTKLRDQYYQSAFEIFKKQRNSNGPFAGIVFWAYGGEAKPIPGQVYWKEGDDYMGDPPMEEQGLNAVFNTDKSTWKLIKKYAK